MKTSSTCWTGAVFKNALEWFYEYEGAVYINLETTHPGVTSSIPFPSDSIQKVMAQGATDIDAGKTTSLEMITLNLGIDAIDKFQYYEEGISFMMRFNRMACDVFIPFEAIISMHNPHTKKVWQGDYRPSGFSIAEKPTLEALVPPAASVKQRPSHLRAVN